MNCNIRCSFSQYRIQPSSTLGSESKEGKDFFSLIHKNIIHGACSSEVHNDFLLSQSDQLLGISPTEQLQKE